jgi:small subunit ribosomal protein S15
VLSKETKTKLIEEFKSNPSDSGSPEIQIALITERINDLSRHFAENKKDHHSRTGLLKMVGRRKRLLQYLKSQDVGRYEKLIKRLNLRK